MSDPRDTVLRLPEKAQYRFICTSSACPEQYDVFDENTKKQVGYVRLRGGIFRVDCPDCGGHTVYTATPKSDGIFDDEERALYLYNAAVAIYDYYEKKNNNEMD